VLDVGRLLIVRGIRGALVVRRCCLVRWCVAEQRVWGDQDAEVGADAVDGGQFAGAEDLGDDG